MIEYVLIVGVVALVALSGFRVFGRTVAATVEGHALCISSLEAAGCVVASPAEQLATAEPALPAREGASAPKARTGALASLSETIDRLQSMLLASLPEPMDKRSAFSPVDADVLHAPSTVVVDGRDVTAAALALDADPTFEAAASPRRCCGAALPLRRPGAAG